MNQTKKTLLILSALALLVVGRMFKADLWTRTGVFSNTNFLIAVVLIAVILILYIFQVGSKKDIKNIQDD